MIYAAFYFPENLNNHKDEVQIFNCQLLSINPTFIFLQRKNERE
jgi:hypothetical protein